METIERFLLQHFLLPVQITWCHLVLNTFSESHGQDVFRDTNTCAHIAELVPVLQMEDGAIQQRLFIAEMREGIKRLRI